MDQQNENCEVTMGWSSYIDTPKQNEQVLHNLWATPVIMAKPFDEEFMQKLRDDIAYLLKPGAPGKFNQTDLWELPDLPETMLAVKSKILELS